MTEARDAARLRKLLALLQVLLVVAPLAAAAHLVLGDAASALSTLVMSVFLGGCYLGARRGAPAGLVATLVVGFGVGVATFMAISAGARGAGALTWVVCAPIVATSVGGRRAGWAVLPLSFLAVTVGLYGIEHGWVVPFMASTAWSTNAISLSGVLVAAFALVRSYDLETQASIEALERRNGELLAAQVRVEEASRAKSEFLATISHEIRTPLHGVTGMVNLLAEESDPARMKQELRIIRSSADALLAVINDVLDFSKIEAGQLDLEALPVSLAAELKAVLELLQPRAEERGNHLELSVKPGVPPWLRGDPTRLRQVMLNLVSNAVKFTSGGRIDCELSREAERVVMRVCDTGIGLTADAKARLFMPFSQADGSTTRRYGGSGLGLVITRRLVTAMRGDITVTSEPGRGTCFVVTLPCEACAAPEPRSSLTPPPTAGPRRTVLVVEDNFVNQVVVVRLLEKAGHQVSVANDGSQALEAMTRQRFDLVLMDVHMPVMDGFAATKALRTRGDQTPIFALTAGVTSDDHARCLEAGMNDVLPKPLRLERLYEVLSQLS